MRARAIIAGAAALLAALTLIAAAGAGQRTRDTFEFSDPFEGAFSCGTFTATFSGQDHGRGSTWFDSTGDPIMQEGHIEARETDVNSATGKSIDVHTRLNVHMDFEAGTIALSGIRHLANEPGAGVVVQHVGRALIGPDGPPISLSGKYLDFAENYMMDDWCAALA